MPEVSATAAQFVVVTYNDDLPNRHVATDDPKNKYRTIWKREVTMPTEQAVDLYNQLKNALYD